MYIYTGLKYIISFIAAYMMVTILVIFSIIIHSLIFGYSKDLRNDPLPASTAPLQLRRWRSR